MESVHYSRVYIKGKETKVERNESAIPPYPRLRCLRAEPTSVVSRTPAVTRKERFLYRRIWFLGFSAASPTGRFLCFDVEALDFFNAFKSFPSPVPSASSLGFGDIGLVLSSLFAFLWSSEFSYLFGDSWRRSLVVSCGFLKQEVYLVVFSGCEVVVVLLKFRFLVSFEAGNMSSMLAPTSWYCVLDRVSYQSD